MSDVFRGYRKAKASCNGLNQYLIFSIKNIGYELPNELSNDVRLRKFRN